MCAAYPTTAAGVYCTPAAVFSPIELSESKVRSRHRSLLVQQLWVKQY
ncbi:MULTISPECIES: hypothetical protein [Microcoleaceae]|nr:hypothetical protein [Tychonema sp. LEGE 06208]MBE9164159.1 hypothetical protein [Tychonema sp. LEGE 06208]